MDPVALLLCAGSAAMIGVYRVALPVGAILYGGLHLGLADHVSWETLLLSVCAGALQSAAGLFLWRCVPSRFKRAMIERSRA